MLAELVDHVIGVDPDRDWVTAAVLDAATAGVLATGRFAANTDGYRQVVAFADEYSTATERAWAVEGTASYGRGLTAALGRCGEWVIEFDRATEKPAKDGSKTDELDAIRLVAKRWVARNWRRLEPTKEPGKLGECPLWPERPRCGPEPQRSTN